MHFSGGVGVPQSVFFDTVHFDDLYDLFRTVRTCFLKISALSFVFVTLLGARFLETDGLSFLFVTLPGAFILKKYSFLVKLSMLQASIQP